MVFLAAVSVSFTSAHRGGSGPPLVCLHGFADTWRTWELLLPALERRHEVLAVTLPGHAGGPSLPAEPPATVMADAVAAAMDDAGWATAHLVGNSLGGFTALQLAARGRARSVVAFAPAGGWAEEDTSWRTLLDTQARMQEQARATAPQAGALLATPAGRRRALALVCEHGDRVPAELAAHLLLGIARCETRALTAVAQRVGYALEVERVTCPVRIVWGAEDRLLPWPSAAAGFRRSLPQADWVLLDDVGHAPQLDAPLEAAELILGWTAP